MNFNKILKTLIVLVAGAGIIGMSLEIKDWVLQSDTFSLESVVVNGNQILQTEDVLNQIEVDSESNITDLNLHEIQSAIEAHPYVKAALVSRRFPSTLQIHIVERKPVAYVSQSDKPLFATDKEGFLLPLLKGKPLGALPVITGIDDFPMPAGGYADSEHVMKALELLVSNFRVDAAYYQNLSEAHFDAKKGLVAYFVNGGFPVYFGHEDFFDRAEKNFVFFQQAQKEGRYDNIYYVDLRFRDQVVVKYH
ncbi:MAG: FtsQ-type POTRA domain-containing protein [bacterium]